MVYSQQINFYLREVGVQSKTRSGQNNIPMEIKMMQVLIGLFDIQYEILIVGTKFVYLH